MNVPTGLIEKAAGIHDIRKHLNDPYLDTEKKRLIATNGHIAAIIPVEVSEADTSGPISAEALKAARKAAKGSPLGGIAPTIACTEKTLEVGQGPTYPRPDLQNKYPDIDKVIPKTKGYIKVGLDAKLLYDLALAIGEGKYKTHVCLHIDPKNSKKGTIYVSNNSDRYGVIMPVRL